MVNCPYCREDLISKDALIGHLCSNSCLPIPSVVDTAKQDPEPMLNEPSVQSEPIVCKLCSKEFPTEELALKHLEKAHRAWWNKNMKEEPTLEEKPKPYEPKPADETPKEEIEPVKEERIESEA